MATTERLHLLLALAEVTYGVFNTPALTDGYAPRDVPTYDVEFGTVDKMRVRPTRVSAGKDLGSMYRKFECEWDLSGPGDPGGADLPQPRWGLFLEASEMVRTDVGLVPVTGHLYTFASRQNQTSLSLDFYEFYLGEPRARQIQLAGCRFFWEFSIGVDEPGLFKFTGCGLFQGNPGERTFSVLDLSGIDYGDNTEQCDSANGKAMVLTIGGVSLNAKSISLKTNRKVEQLQSVVATYGVEACYVTADKGAVFELEIDPIIDDVATLDFWDDILTQVLKAVVIQVDTAQGSRITINIPGAQSLEFSREDDKNLIRRKQMIYPVDCDTDTGDTALTVQIERTP
jgi:hypothetical protein